MRSIYSRWTAKTALVTGCRHGIGMAMAIALAEAGADIVVSAPLLRGTEARLTVKYALTGASSAVTSAIWATAAHYSFIDRLKADFPVIAVLMNNAGIILRKPAADHSDELWDRVVDINLSSQFVLSREIDKDRGLCRVFASVGYLGGDFTGTSSTSHLSFRTAATMPMTVPLLTPRRHMVAE